MLDRAHEEHGVLLEAPPGIGDGRAGLVAGEEPAAELLLERPDARADRRLLDVQPFGGADEAAGGHDPRKVRANSVSTRANVSRKPI
jgi:hypothetical protein